MSKDVVVKVGSQHPSVLAHREYEEALDAFRYAVNDLCDEHLGSGLLGLDDMAYVLSMFVDVFTEDDDPEERPTPENMAKWFGCKDCGVDTSAIKEYYVVNDEVWKAGGLEKDGGMLCIGCLEDRLGRKLQPSDFNMDAGLNHGTFGWSKRMQDRLGV